MGVVETEVEVPAGDAQRIDLWHVPNPELSEAHPEIEPGPRPCGAIGGCVGALVVAVRR